MLFLLRPRQTYMPYGLPRDPKQMAERDQLHQQAFESAAPPSAPSTAVPDLITQLKDLVALRASDALTDEEFARLKAKVLDDSG